MNFYFYKTHIADVTIAANSDSITNIFFERKNLNNSNFEETDLLREGAKELDNYFCGKLKVFSVKINPAGSHFMKSVWDEVLKIPYGKTASYKNIASAMGNEKANRAIGLANSRNPIPIIIPCHRIIGSDGNLVGYSSGIHMKKKLLELEKYYLKQE